MRRVKVEPGSELDRALGEAEDVGEPVELVRGTQAYLLRPMAGRPLSEQERAWRRALVERTRAHRDSQPPLGISTDQLIRETRAERYGD